MILVISNIADEAATVLVDMFPAGSASLITASDLHESFKTGISIANFESSEVRVNNVNITVREISGVITTISYFLPQEFYYIEAADRQYVCAEVNAFFIYFLSGLKCKKVNPPSRKTLSGHGIHKIEWLKTVHKLDVPLWPFHLNNGMPATLDRPSAYQYLKATLIGDVLLGDRTSEKVTSYMRLIAKAFSQPYVSCSFVSPNGIDYFLVDVMSIVDISTPENREAIVNYFQNNLI